MPLTSILGIFKGEEGTQYSDFLCLRRIFLNLYNQHCKQVAKFSLVSEIFNIVTYNSNLN